jgi:hypothetical protein
MRVDLAKFSELYQKLFEIDYFGDYHRRAARRLTGSLKSCLFMCRFQWMASTETTVRAKKRSGRANC